MIDWIIVGAIVATATAIIVRHERRARAQMRTDHTTNWWARRVEERDHFVHQGTLLSRAGVPALAPENFNSKWEHAQATYRYMVGGKLPYAVRIGARRSRPTTIVDGITHHVAVLQHDGCSTPVLMCDLDHWVDENETEITDEARPATCLMCAVKSREHYGRG